MVKSTKILGSRLGSQTEESLNFVALRPSFRRTSHLSCLGVLRPTSRCWCEQASVWILIVVDLLLLVIVSALKCGQYVVSLGLLLYPDGLLDALTNSHLVCCPCPIQNLPASHHV